jgi:hypothetical protein
MSSTELFRVKRAEHASLSRSRPPDDPDLLAARQIMQEESTIAALEAALDKAPPVMSPALRARIVRVLSARGMTETPSVGTTPVVAQTSGGDAP